MIDKAIFCLCKQLASIHHTVIKPWIYFKKRTRSQAKALVITFQRQRQITDKQTNLVVAPYELQQEPIAAAAFPHPSSSSLRPSCRYLFPSSCFQSQDLPSCFQSQDLRLRPIDDYPEASALAHLNKIPRESQGLQFRKSSLLKLQEEKLLSEPFSRWDWPPAFPLLSSVTDPSNSTSVKTLSSSSSCSLSFATSCCSPSAAASIAKIRCEKTAKVNDRCKTLIKINNLVDWEWIPTSIVINTFLVKIRENLGSPISSFKIVRRKNSLQSCPIFFQQFSIMCGHTFIPHSREMLPISSFRGMQDSFFSKRCKCSCVNSGSHLKVEFALILKEDTNSTCLHKQMMM